MSSFLKNFNICMFCSENDEKNTCIRVFSERITFRKLFTGKFSAGEPKWLTGLALGIGIVSTCEETTCEILPIGTKCCSVFGNIYVTRALFCQPVSLQILNSMPAITLLFPRLNTNQIWEQCQPV